MATLKIVYKHVDGPFSFLSTKAHFFVLGIFNSDILQLRPGATNRQKKSLMSSSFSSSSPQTFQEHHPLVHDSLHFVHPHTQSISHKDYYLTSSLTINKQKQQQKQLGSPRRFSYAELLSGQEATNAYDDNSDPYYVPLPSSSPSNDSDDYRYSHSSGSDTSTSPTNDQISFAETTGSLRPFSMNEPSMSFHMGGSPIAAPHRHSIATNPFSFGTPSPFYDTQRTHRASQPSLYETPANHLQQQQQQQYFTSNNSGLMRGFLPPRPKDEQQGMVNDLCFSPFSMSSSGKGPLVRSHESGFVPDNKSSTTMTTPPTTKKVPRSRGRRVSNIPGNGSQMFVCKTDGCGKIFKRSEHLKRHIRSIHTLEKRK